METKLCKKCKIEKQISDFGKDRTRKDGYFPYCKECCNKDSKENYIKNKSEKIKYQKEYYQNHKKEKRQYDIEYREKNKKKRNLQESYNYANDNVYKLKKSIRGYLYKCLKGTKYTNKSKIYNILGCDYLTFINHMYNSFEKRYGYKYDSQIEINIDHIIPLDIAKNEEEIIKLNHYTNLQLLTKKDNLLKGRKIIGG